MKVILIEDDSKLSIRLTESLKEHGFSTIPLASRTEVDEILESHITPDVILMDRLVGGFDTKLILGRIKQKWPLAPLIVVSAVSTPNERTDLINMGADDYIGKPFSTQELIARMKSQLRRPTTTSGNYLQLGNLILDLIKRVAVVEGQSESLTAREFALLRLLTEVPEKIWSRDDLLDYVWGSTVDVETNVVEVTVANLRKKLEKLEAKVYIRNMRNAGYWITA